MRILGKMLHLFLFISFVDLQLSSSLFAPVSLYSHNVSTQIIAVEWSIAVNAEAEFFMASISPLDTEILPNPVQRTTQTYAAWSGLVPGKTYDISVQTEDRNGDLSMPAIITVTTDPSPPYNVRVSKFVNPVLMEYLFGQNRTMLFPVYGAVVSWDGPDSELFDGFDIRVTPPDGIIRLPITLDQGEPVSQTTKRRRIVWDLVPGIYYDFQIRTKSNGRLSTEAHSGIRMPPEVPGPITVTSVTSTRVVLTWDDPHRGVLDGFVVEIDPPVGTVLETNGAEAKWREIVDLMPGSRYRFDVFSTSNGEFSFQSRAIEVNTPPEMPQGPIRVSNITLTSVFIRWTRPVGQFDYYEIVYFPKIQGVGRIRHRVLDPIVRISSLTPNTEYSIIIYAVSKRLYSQPLHGSFLTASIFTPRLTTATVPQFRITTVATPLPRTTSEIPTTTSTTTTTTTQTHRATTSSGVLIDFQTSTSSQPKQEITRSPTGTTEKSTSDTSVTTTTFKRRLATDISSTHSIASSFTDDKSAPKPITRPSKYNRDDIQQRMFSFDEKSGTPNATQRPIIFEETSRLTFTGNSLLKDIKTGTVTRTPSLLQIITNPTPSSTSVPDGSNMKSYTGVTDGFFMPVKSTATRSSVVLNQTVVPNVATSIGIPASTEILTTGTLVPTNANEDGSLHTSVLSLTSKTPFASAATSSGYRETLTTRSNNEVTSSTTYESRFTDQQTNSINAASSSKVDTTFSIANSSTSRNMTLGTTLSASYVGTTPTVSENKTKTVATNQTLLTLLRTDPILMNSTSGHIASFFYQTTSNPGSVISSPSESITSVVTNASGTNSPMSTNNNVASLFTSGQASDISSSSPNVAHVTTSVPSNRGLGISTSPSLTRSAGLQGETATMQILSTLTTQTSKQNFSVSQFASTTLSTTRSGTSIFGSPSSSAPSSTNSKLYTSDSTSRISASSIAVTQKASTPVSPTKESFLSTFTTTGSSRFANFTQEAILLAQESSTSVSSTATSQSTPTLPIVNTGATPNPSTISTTTSQISRPSDFASSAAATTSNSFVAGTFSSAMRAMSTNSPLHEQTNQVITSVSKTNAGYKTLNITHLSSSTPLQTRNVTAQQPLGTEIIAKSITSTQTPPLSTQSQFFNSTSALSSPPLDSTTQLFQSPLISIQNTSKTGEPDATVYVNTSPLLDIQTSDMAVQKTENFYRSSSINIPIGPIASTIKGLEASSTSTNFHTTMQTNASSSTNQGTELQSTQINDSSLSTSQINGSSTVSYVTSTTQTNYPSIFPNSTSEQYEITVASTTVNFFDPPLLSTQILNATQSPSTIILSNRSVGLENPNGFNPNDSSTTLNIMSTSTNFTHSAPLMSAEPSLNNQSTSAYQTTNPRETLTPSTTILGTRNLVDRGAGNPKFPTSKYTSTTMKTFTSPAISKSSEVSIRKTTLQPIGHQDKSTNIRDGADSSAPLVTSVSDMNNAIIQSKATATTMSFPRDKTSRNIKSTAIPTSLLHTTEKFDSTSHLITSTAQTASGIFSTSTSQNWPSTVSRNLTLDILNQTTSSPQLSPRILVANNSSAAFVASSNVETAQTTLTMPQVLTAFSDDSPIIRSGNGPDKKLFNNTALPTLTIFQSTVTKQPTTAESNTQITPKLNSRDIFEGTGGFILNSTTETILNVIDSQSTITKQPNTEENNTQITPKLNSRGIFEATGGFTVNLTTETILNVTDPQSTVTKQPTTAESNTQITPKLNSRGIFEGTDESTVNLTTETILNVTDSQSTVTKQPNTEENNTQITPKLNSRGIFEATGGFTVNLTTETILNVTDPQSTVTKQPTTAESNTQITPKLNSRDIFEATGGFTVNLTTETILNVTDSQSTVTKQPNTEENNTQITPKLNSRGIFEGTDESTVNLTTETILNVTDSQSTVTIQPTTAESNTQTPKLNSRGIFEGTDESTVNTTTKATRNTTDSTSDEFEENGETTNGGSVLTVHVNGNVIVIRNGFSTTCKPDNITVLVNKNVIGKYEKKYGPLHLNDFANDSCKGTEYPDYYRYTIAPNILDCGTAIELNETHVNFTNSITNKRQKNSWLSSAADNGVAVVLGNRLPQNTFKFVHLRLWCTFPLDLNVTSVYPFLPQLTLQVLNFNVSGYGEFSAIMQLFKTSLYNETYLVAPTLNSTETLYVAVALLEIADNDTFVVLEDCWGTPSRSPNNSQTYPIIRSSCPVNESLDGSVRITGNGAGRIVRWEGKVFKFVSFAEVWLHCSVKICFGDDCEPNCEKSRRKRSVNDATSNHVVSTGPITLIKGASVDPTASNPSDKGITERPMLPFLPDVMALILIALLVILVLTSCIILFFLAGRWRRKPREAIKPKATISLPTLSSPPEEETLDDNNDYLTIIPNNDNALLKRAGGYNVGDNVSQAGTTMSVSFSNRDNSLESRNARRGNENRSYVSNESTDTVTNIDEIDLENAIYHQLPSVTSNRISAASFETVDSANITSSF